MIRTVTAVVLAGLLAAACTQGSTSAPTSSAAASGSTVFKEPVQLTGAEQRYGTSAEPQAGVTYQPNVVFIGGGAKAVKSVDEGGLVWTLDGHAPGVADLAVGKVMLATSFGAGRVLALGSAGPDVRVVLGPVDLTDIYRDADLGSSAPIPVKDVYAYPTIPADIGSLVTTGDAALHTNSASERPLDAPPHPAARGGVPTSLPTPPAVPRLPSAPSGVPMPIGPTAAPPTVSAAGFQFSPFWNGKGLGVHIGYKHGDGVFLADLTLHMDAPSTTFRIGIRNGKLSEATVGLHGAASISLDVKAASESTAGSFKTQEIPIPLTVAIPLGNLLTLRLTQTVEISMQFLGKAEITSHGSYTVKGDLGFGYRNGSIFGGAVAEGIVDPLTNHTKSLGVAATSYKLTWSPKVSISVGLLVFDAGLFYALDFTVALTSQTVLETLDPGCVQDSLLLQSYYGYRWHVLGVVMDVVNAIIGIFGAKKLPNSGYKRWGPTVLWKPKPGNWCPH